MAFFDSHSLVDRRAIMTTPSQSAHQYHFAASPMATPPTGPRPSSRDTLPGHFYSADSALPVPSSNVPMAAAGTHQQQQQQANTSYYNLAANPMPATRSPPGPPSSVGMIQLGRRRGFTRFFNSVKGFGFVIDSNPAELNGSDVFVHFTQIASHRGVRRDLAEGEEVEYDLLLGPKGYQAANVTGPGGRKVIGSLQSRAAARPPQWPGEGALGMASFTSYAASLPSNYGPAAVWNASSSLPNATGMSHSGATLPSTLPSSLSLPTSSAQSGFAMLAATKNAAAPGHSALFNETRFTPKHAEPISWSMIEKASRETARLATSDLLNSPPRFVFAPFNSPPASQHIPLAAGDMA